MKRWIFLFVFSTYSLFSFTLQDKFEEGDEGSYIVIEQNELVTLLHLHTKKEGRFLFEEVSIPTHLSKNIEWKTWLLEGALGATSWILYEVDPKKECVTECYSLTRGAWISTDEMNAFLIPLMSLNLDFLSEDKRLQKGPTPRPGNVEAHPWAPPQVKEGKKIKSPEYDVYTAKWPHDSTNLSGKQIVLYFDKAETTFPFPYWLQARDGAVKFKMRALDSGHGMSSPTTDIPRRSLSFSTALHKENGKLYLTLDAPPYYDSLFVYAVDLTTSPKVTHSLSFETKRKKEQLTLLIDEEKLNHLFTSGHEYLWIVSSESHDMSVEAPFTYIHQ